METSSVGVEGLRGTLSINELTGLMETVEGHHIILDAGDDDLNEHQKNAYGLKLAEIYEFWQSLRSFQVCPPNNSSVSVGEENGLPQQLKTVDLSATRKNEIPSSPHGNPTTTPITSTLPKPNTQKVVNNGDAQLLVTSVNKNDASPFVSTVTVMSVPASPVATHCLPQQIFPLIRLKPQSQTSNLFNSSSTLANSAATSSASSQITQAIGAKPPPSQIRVLTGHPAEAVMRKETPVLPANRTLHTSPPVQSIPVVGLVNNETGLSGEQSQPQKGSSQPPITSPYGMHTSLPSLYAQVSGSAVKPRSTYSNKSAVAKPPSPRKAPSLDFSKSPFSHATLDLPVPPPVNEALSLNSPKPSSIYSSAPLGLPFLPPTREEVVAKPLKTFPASKKLTNLKQLKNQVSVIPAPTTYMPNGSKNLSDTVDLTDDDNNLQAKPQNEFQQDIVLSNQKKGMMREKTFPSLVVTVRASLKIFPHLVTNNERLLMDTQMRKVMQMTPSIFTEYLLQKRLLRTEPICKTHGKNLKLGMYSDPSKFPHSGGYVWIAECCSSGFNSVFQGSIFDKTQQPPTAIVKLMYHWACNTAVHNVLNWVKVDNFVVKTYYTFFRAVCTSTVHEKSPLLGGPQQKVQVGIISVGTTAQASENGERREVKVDIMAAMDPKTQTVRLRALDNFFAWPSNKVYESKFKRILEVLQNWVHPQSIIITDFAVDLSLCRQYGFSEVVISGGLGSYNNNSAVVDYLRAKIPNMFQNTLSLLSFQIIQQFLDELVWREVWGPIPSRAFENLVSHTAEMTKLAGPDLIVKLKKIASHPFKNWKYSVWQKSEAPSPKMSPTPEETRKDPGYPPKPVEVCPVVKKPLKKEIPATVEKEALPVQQTAKCPSPIQERFIVLESHYYGFVDGDPRLLKNTGAFLAECTFCKRDFLSASSFTSHLIHHSLNSLEDLSSLQPDQLLTICPKCFNPVRYLNDHMQSKHPEPAPGTARYCEICALNQGSNDKLFKHMTYMHCELDVPYECQICFFRTSIYKDAASHFKSFHDKDTCLQCPFCFRIVRFCAKNGLEISRNQIYFVQHIQKHSNPKLNRKCEKCVLSFFNMGTLKDHQERYHTSAVNLSNIERCSRANLTMMPAPTVTPYPPLTLHESSFHTLNGKALSSSIKVDPYVSQFLCAECDSSINQSHFSIKMTCTRCLFHSNCANAIREHSARVHIPPNSTDRGQMLGGYPLVEKTLYCSLCSFHSNNGNRMAAHLSWCNYAQGEKPVATSVKRKFNSSTQPDTTPSRKLKKRRICTPGSFEDPPDF